MSITDILEQKKISDSRIYGVVVGIVTNNKDTEKLGRVKVKIPRLSGEDESNWARVTSFMAGKERGAFFLPEVDDEVLVAFEYGDINMPYVIGSLWNGKDVPPENNSDGKNNIRVIRSRSGHVITLDDSDGSEQIKIMDKTQKNMIIIDAKNNTISIKSDKDIELSAPNGKVTIEAMDLVTKSTASTKIEATSSVDVKASGNLNIKGAMVNIN
ncbi:MAG: phage baseplate assembly protein V [Methanosarcinales archaeon]|nr:phage baseplate assembly protein V [Methanosarcinales archaeon]MCD4810822.1 phage baseplate assembly protein V [Methanosarcinales archaeon]